MSRPVEYETLKRQLAEMTRKFEKLENQTERKESLERRKRTRELIKTGAKVKKNLQGVDDERLDIILDFLNHYIGNPKEKNLIRDQYLEYKKEWLKEKYGDISPEP